MDGSNINSDAFSIFIDGNDVYVAGYTNGNNACYWKNGNLNVLDTNPGITIAYSIYVRSVIVFVGGETNGGAIACFWVNGKRYDFSDNRAAYSIYSDNYFNVYLAGTYDNLNNNGFFWSNGNYSFVNGLNFLRFKPNVYFKSKYLCCWPNSSGFGEYYKNGQLLYTDSTASQYNSIYVKNSDIYICGLSGALAYYWKNNSPQTLINGTDAYQIYIYIYGSDVYISGIASGPAACFWKNDNQIILSNPGTSSIAYSIFVADE